MYNALEVLHTITPFVLSLPVVTLAPPPRVAPSDELPGVRSITVKTVTPRRGWILLTLWLLSFTAFLDGVSLVIDCISAPNRHIHHSTTYVVCNAIYSIGGLSVYALAAILAEWRTRWGDSSIRVLAVFALALEIPNLVLSVILETHSVDSEHVFAILALPTSALRLLLLPVLFALVSNPIVRFTPADERTGLLENVEAIPEGSSGRVYGTFDNGGDAPGNPKPDTDENSRPPRTATATPAPQAGTSTPTGAAPQIKIPKKLGEKEEQSQGITWKAFWSRLWKLSPHLWPSTSPKLQVFCVLCLGIVILGRLLYPMIPLTLGMLVRALTQNQQNGGQGPSPWPPFAAYFILRVIQGGGGLSFIQNILWIPVQQYADREMQLLCFNHLLNLSLAFHTKRNTGEVLKIIDRGSAINNLLQTLMFSAGPTMLDIIIAFGVFFVFYGWALALLIGVVMSAYVCFSILLTNYRTKLRRQMIDRDIKQRGIASDVLTNWESVKYFTAEHREVNRFSQAVDSYLETEAKVSISFNLINLVQSFIIAFGLLAGSIIISNRVLNGTADAAEYVVFIQYLQQLYGPLDRLGMLYRQLNQNSTDAEKLFNLLAQPKEIQDKPGAKELVVTDGVIEFDNVCFSYDGTVQALKGVSFKIGRGESMALVGESGSGKSTILRLLYRFYDITSGHIYIDGQDISEVTQLSLRRAIGIVPQDSVLWNDTIGANVSYGKEGANDDEIIVAAKAARLHERILSFPDGYATIVGERGVRLSGGEKQRVSLARMFLKSPAILVLDEATSALDTETEREIQRALADLARNRSSLSIAHRLSTIINSDQIVVMKNGSVVEQGSYQELVELDGHFGAMWKKQIFTEAEMVADAENNGQAAAALKLLEDKVAAETEESVDNSDRILIHRASPPSTVHEQDEGHSDDFGQDDAPEDETRFKNNEDAETSQGYTIPTQMDAAAENNDDHDASSKADTRPPVVDLSKTVEDDGPSYAEVAAPSTETIPETEPAPTVVSNELPVVPHAEQAVDLTKKVEDDGPSYAAVAAPETSAPAQAEIAPEPVTPLLAPTSADVATSPAASLSRSSSTKGSPAFLSARLPSSASQRSGLSESAASSDGTELASGSGDKRRKRLSSIKGFVRRISDQGKSVGSGSAGGSGTKSPGNLSRSKSMGSRSSTAPGTPGTPPAGGESPGTPGTPTDERKKRLSLNIK